MKLKSLLPTLTLLTAIVLIVGGFTLFTSFDNANANEAPVEKEPTIGSLPVVPKNTSANPATATPTPSTTQTPSTTNTPAPSTGNAQPSTTSTTAAPSTTATSSNTNSTGSTSQPVIQAPAAPTIPSIQGEVISESGKTSTTTTGSTTSNSTSSKPAVQPKAQEIKFNETPRSGGIEIALGIFVAMVLSGGIYYYKNHGDSKQVLKTAEGKLPKAKSRRK